MRILTHSFFYTAIALAVIGVIIVLSPILFSIDLIHPLRLNEKTLLLQQQQKVASKKLMANETGKIFLNPQEAGMPFQKVEFIHNDGTIIRGWYITADSTANTSVALLHDVNEGKLAYLELAYQLFFMGYNTLLIDMKAHGNSDGSEFGINMGEAQQCQQYVHFLKSEKQQQHVFIFGKGCGAAIAMLYATMDTTLSGLLLQSPFNNFSDYIDRKIFNKFESYTWLVQNPIKINISKKGQLPPLATLIKTIKIPVFIIMGSADTVILPEESTAVYDSSTHPFNRIMNIKNGQHDDLEVVAGKQYYEEISSFIQLCLPKKKGSARAKQLT
jgi:uncharacterized protein